jgi:hypothetical protein
VDEGDAMAGMEKCDERRNNVITVTTGFPLGNTPGGSSRAIQLY